MGIITGFVLFAVIWFMVLFVVLPIRRRTQDDEGKIVPGTHAGAPSNFNVRRTVLIVTAVAVPLWLVIGGVIFSGVIGLSELGWTWR
ncbi:MAG: DUF1467 family protein [Paracoccaceae bacterium]